MVFTVLKPPFLGGILTRIRRSPEKVIIVYSILVGGLEHFLFFHVLGIVTPTDELIFFRGVGLPPTSIYIYIPLYIPIVGWLNPNFCQGEAKEVG